MESGLCCDEFGVWLEEEEEAALAVGAPFPLTEELPPPTEDDVT